MICALVLAAGLSRRMGKPKLLLPWGETNVIGQVISTLQASGVPHILVVTGANREALERNLLDGSIRFVFNPAYENGEMLDSIQTGLSGVGNEIQSALIVLGDQPQIQTGVVEQVCAAVANSPGSIIVPSFQMHRGHPWVLPRLFWEEVLAIRLPKTMRDFMRAHSGEIKYIEVQTPTILMDLDTPEDYQQAVGHT